MYICIYVYIYIYIYISCIYIYIYIYIYKCSSHDGGAYMAAVLVATKGSLSRTLPHAACVLQVQTAHPNIHNPNIHTTRNIHTRGTRPFCTGVPLS